MSSVYDSEDENAVHAFFVAMDNSIQNNHISSTSRIRLDSVGEEDIDSEFDWPSPPMNENTHWGWGSEEDQMEIFEDSDLLDIFDENNFHYDLIYEDPLMNADAFNEDAMNDIEMGLIDAAVVPMDVDIIDVNGFYFLEPESRPISPSIFLTNGAIQESINVDISDPVVLNGTAPAVFHLEHERLPKNNPVIIDLTSDDEEEEEEEPRDEIKDNTIIEIPNEEIIIEISDDDE